MRYSHPTRWLLTGMIVFVMGGFVSVMAGVDKIAFSETSAQTTTTCGTGYGVVAGTSSAGQLQGVVTVSVGVPSSAPPIAKVVVRANGQPIGRAQQTTAGSTYWSMPWVTSLFPNGTVLVDAEIFWAGSTASCFAHSVNTTSQMVFNPTASTGLRVFTQPTSWQGPMSYSVPMSAVVKSDVTTIDLTQYALYQWIPTLGSSPYVHHQAQYYSGQTVGTGTVTVKVRYGGAMADVAIPVNVQNTSAPLPGTSTNTTQTTSQSTAPSSTTTGTNSTTTTGTATSPTAATTPTPAAVQNTAAAQDCLASVLGQERFALVNTAQVRPTAAELEKIKICFAASKYIMPANFAPVAPVAVKDLGNTNQTTVHKLENVTTAKTGSETKALQISGTAKPHSVVVIYVFSDPLVLTTVADESGNWSYTLENPIEPGSHEVYSVVDRGDGVYERSAPLSFVIATAQAEESNPQGLSLTLADTQTAKQSNTSMIMYLAAAGATLLMVLLGFFVLLRVRRRNSERALHAASSSTPLTVPPTDTPAQVISPVVVPDATAQDTVVPPAGDAVASSQPDPAQTEASNNTPSA